MNRATIPPIVMGVLAASLGVAVVVGFDLDSPLRQAIALCFLFFTPGMAFVPLLAIDDPVFEWTLFVAVSLTLDAIIGTVMVYAGLWSPEAALVVLIALSLIGSSVQLASARRISLSGSANR